MEVYTSARCPIPSRDLLNSERIQFRNMVVGFANFTSTAIGHIAIDWNVVDELSTRIHQRMNYYLFFHNANLLQSRQGALKAYWILKYRPLRIKSAVFWDEEYDINVHFAFHVLFAQALGEFLVNCPRGIQLTVVTNILREYKNDHIRAFSEHDISKEAMMLISGSIKSIVECEIKNCS